MKVEQTSVLESQANEILADLHATKEPVLLTEEGKPSAYLLDAEDFEKMQQRMQLLENIAKGELAIQEGKVFRQGQTEEKLRKWLK